MGRLIFLGVIVSIIIIVRTIEFCGQKIRDRSAKVILKEFDYQKEKNGILGVQKGIQKQEIHCPICGGMLTIKTGKHGEFIGCKNYPICSFTKNI